MQYTLHAPGSRKGNRTYIVRAYVNGSRIEKVLAATARTVAKEEAERFLDSIKGGPADAPVTFADAARAYLQFRRPRKEDETKVERLIAFFGDRPVADVTGADLVAAAEHLLPRAANATRNRSVIVPASAVLHYAAEQRWCPYARHRRLPVSRRSTRKPASPGVIQALLANTTGHKHLLFAWLYETGQRIGDSLSLTRDDLDLPRAVARIASSKTDDHGEIGLSPELVAMLANAAPQPDGRVFPWRVRQSVYKWLWPLCRQLGVKYTPHQSRHAMATDLRVLGWDVKAIADRGLWRDERTLERYIHHRSSGVPAERGVVVVLEKRKAKAA
jgi:integrase